MISNRLLLLLWVILIHLAGIYLFTRGFLLTRLSLPHHTACDAHNEQCTLPPTHKRAVVLIVDALRFDFVTPNPPTKASPFHHNILTLPRELTARYPKKSFLFNSYADPPTTTMQRIKGITTGSLPTFVDMGSNFGSQSIEEDSILKQLELAGKRAAFMGDDTWMSVFPNAFQPNMSFPYDSFNVEDLHTVDEGVIRHLFPLLEDPSKPFDFLVGHFLGVDHVGHRVGPDHPSMKSKLTQMNDVLKRVVDLLDDDTLLVLMGDHGMSRSGDHGGDSVHETSAALWIYSKGRELSQDSIPLPPGLLRYSLFPGTSVSHRTIQQIDVLPTISLLLGLPIPFNNLGTVIPDLFWQDTTGTRLAQALKINVAQVKTYLDTYRSSSSGDELDEAWPALQSAYTTIEASSSSGETQLITLSNYIRIALLACRAMWAQFNQFLMGMGLAMMALGLFTSWVVYSDFKRAKDGWNDWLGAQLPRYFRGMAGGSAVGFVLHLALDSHLLSEIDALDAVVFTALLFSCIVAILSSPPRITSIAPKSIPIILILHTISFFSNSFTFWEDRIVPFLLVTAIVPHVLTGFAAPVMRLKYRILGFSLLYAACVRLISISTVCREEQQPYCHVTFYASSSVPSPPLLVLFLALPVAAGLPWAMLRFLNITRSDGGVAKLFVPLVLRPALFAGSMYWVVDWIDTVSILGDGWGPLLRTVRTCVAWLVFALALFGGGMLWWKLPLCLDLQVEQTLPSTPTAREKRQVQVIGYANAYGAPYIFFWSILFAVVFVATQLTGQIVLTLAAVALLAYLEVLDSVRDVQNIQAAFASSNPSTFLDVAAGKRSPAVKFADVVPVALLAVHTFFGTGHQSTVSSIQWKTAFLLMSTTVYPFSPLTVVINSVGALAVMALASPLVALWNRAPISERRKTNTGATDVSKATADGETRAAGEMVESDIQVKGETTLAALGYMTYFATLLFGASVSAAILRRHLMVWKVFAPRFMTGVLGVLTTDVAVVLGVGIGVERITRRVGVMFRKLSR